MKNLKETILENVIKLTWISEKKFKKGDFKGAIQDKREVRSILNSRLLDVELNEKFKEELSKLYLSKFDLIYDHKLRLDDLKRKNIIKYLEQKSDEKFKKGDYKGAIKALRRSEKYLSK